MAGAPVTGPVSGSVSGAIAGPGDDRISAAEAASRLGVKRETIYAYVSRGLISSERHLDGKSSTFDPSEIERLRRRRNSGRPGRLEVPVASSITEVVDGSVAYRGHPVDSLLAAGHHYEDAAELLWTAELVPAEAWRTSAHTAEAIAAAVAALPGHASPIDRMMTGVIAAGANDAFSDDRSPEGVVSSGRILVRAIVDAMPMLPGAEVGPHGSDQLACHLWPRLTAHPDAPWPLLDRALILLADHGMATSTLAARLAASTRAAPHAVLVAALGALAGPLHGGASRSVHELFDDTERNGADAALAAIMYRDGRVPGIGHFIHKTRDPRHDLLFEAIADAPLDEFRLDVVASVVSRTSDRIPVAPNVDFALGALTYITGMAPTAGEAIFAIARTAGWLAHAIEEYEETPIRFRPVGRYVSPR